jgi:hypothetical protein
VVHEVLLCGNTRAVILFKFGCGAAFCPLPTQAYQASPSHFVLVLSLSALRTAASLIQRPSPPSADYGKEIELATRYGLTAEGTGGFSELT